MSENECTFENDAAPSTGGKKIKNKFDMTVSDKHVYNQLRTWKSKWSRICTLKTLSSCVVWKPEIRTIEMPEAVYTEYIKVTR